MNNEALNKEIILTAKDLSKTFSNESVQQHVLKNLDISIYKGDFTVIMGNSGKSTLLYALSGMDRPTLGTITYNVEPGKLGKGQSSSKGIEISKFSNDKLAMFRRDHAGFVFQQNYLNDTMSALDNVMISGLLKNKDRKALAEKAKKLLGRVEISEADCRKFPAQMSGGMQQRVAVVRGVINDPEVLFADEPTGALNRASSDEVMKELININHDGTTIMCVTHDPKVAAKCTRVIYLIDGSIVGEKTLGSFDGSEKALKDREREVNGWLMEQGW